MTDAVCMKNIVKSYPGVLACNKVSIEIQQGEVHALLGENGAGKTTLMNILFGLSRADSGEIFIKGKQVSISSPCDAIDLGIGMVHQHFMLIPVFTVAENVILSHCTAKEPLLKLDKAEARVAEISKSYGLAVDPKAKIRHLSVGSQQRVEIVKVLIQGADILILDEPTAVLTPRETEELFSILRQLVSEGHTVIFITHKLKEVMAISHRVTVLRGGHVIGTVNTKDTDIPSLARMMVGRDVSFQKNLQSAHPGEKVLEVVGMNAMSDSNRLALRDISFDIRQGEILGVAGVDGNGQSELAEVIMGLRRISSGDIKIKGKSIKSCSPMGIIENGVSCIPSNRQTMGLVNSFSIAEGLMLKEWRKRPFVRNSLFDYSAIQDHGRKMLDEYDIRAPGPHVKIGNLSGGNQQKLVLARELSRHPDLLIASQPTRGLDIGAEEFVHKRLIGERARGAAILLISTELDEILSLCDRIIVLYEGQIMGCLDAKKADIHEKIGLMMAGIKK